MINTQFNDELMERVLGHLGLEHKAPTLRYLNQLISAHVRRVPWESITRIIKRSTTQDTEDCPRWPVEFWRSAVRYGSGGTCFESSLAFYTLLSALGYQGYLTVNDMGTHRACHAAITVLLKDQKYLVDVTIPVHKAVRIIPGKTARARTFFHTYSIRTVGEDRYQVERSGYPNRTAFTLIDLPVAEPDFRDVVTADYTETGHFLKSVVIVKVIGDKVWRFNSEEKPFRLTGFSRSERTFTILSPETLARTLARKFLLPEEKISMALNYIEHLPVNPGLHLSSSTSAAGISLAGGG